jgi:hypothetical protein
MRIFKLNKTTLYCTNYCILFDDILPSINENFIYKLHNKNIIKLFNIDDINFDEFREITYYHSEEYKSPTYFTKDFYVKEI